MQFLFDQSDFLIRSGSETEKLLVRQIINQPSSQNSRPFHKQCRPVTGQQVQQTPGQSFAALQRQSNMRRPWNSSSGRCVQVRRPSLHAHPGNGQSRQRKSFVSRFLAVSAVVISRPLTSVSGTGLQASGQQCVQTAWETLETVVQNSHSLIS